MLATVSETEAIMCAGEHVRERPCRRSRAATVAALAALVLPGAVLIFADGFESATTSSWSAAVP